MIPETRYALMILGLSIIWKMTLLLTGLNLTAFGKYPLMLILAFMIIGLYRGMEERRKLDHVDAIDFPKLFKSGMSIAALFTITYSLFLYVYLKFLDSNFMGRMVENRVIEAQQNHANPESIEAWKNSAESFPFISIWILFTFFGLMVFGAFASGMIARMMRKKHPAKR